MYHSDIDLNIMATLTCTQILENRHHLFYILCNTTTQVKCRTWYNNNDMPSKRGRAKPNHGFYGTNTSGVYGTCYGKANGVCRTGATTHKAQE